MQDEYAFGFLELVDEHSEYELEKRLLEILNLSLGRWEISMHLWGRNIAWKSMGRNFLWFAKKVRGRCKISDIFFRLLEQGSAFFR